MVLGKLANGLMGNFSEQDSQKLTTEYQDFLFADEVIMKGYQLIRDALIFTNFRIIFVDKQGATGKKTAFQSIYLDDIIDVEVETAGALADDSELTITYLTNVYQRSNQQMTETKTFEFPKNTNIAELYTMIGDMVIKNRRRINN